MGGHNSPNVALWNSSIRDCDYNACTAVYVCIYNMYSYCVWNIHWVRGVCRMQILVCYVFIRFVYVCWHGIIKHNRWLFICVLFFFFRVCGGCGGCVCVAVCCCFFFPGSHIVDRGIVVLF